MDFEMHTVHLTRDEDKTGHGIIAAALGILFSVDNYTAEIGGEERDVINRFFDSLQMGPEGDPVVNEVAYGDLINMVDFHNRWVYDGSVTTPPCATRVFWNEISTIYPIERRHVDGFKEELRRAKGYPEGMTLDTLGNFRVTGPIDNHNVMYVT